jgi:alpha-tubulin suppressor-like RCC1 family protein
MLNNDAEDGGHSNVLLSEARVVTVKINFRRLFGVLAIVVGLLLTVALVTNIPAAASTASRPTFQTGPSSIAFVAVSAGARHTCALTARGGVKCWGNNGIGQLGDGTKMDHYTPIDVIGLTGGVIAISAGKFHTCALLATRAVKCWGQNNLGQLGDGTNTNRFAPVDVISLTSDVASIEVGVSDTCALTTGGAARCWGGNMYGQLGDGTTTDRPVPADVSGLTSGVLAIHLNDAGGGHVCAVLVGGGLKCWGANYEGQLGDGTTTDRYTPVDVSGLTSGVRDMELGLRHTCAVMINGTVKCWGANASGQLGDNTTTPHLTPVDVSGSIDSAIDVAAATDYTCILLSTGNVKCWGQNSVGQVGDATLVDRSAPVDVSGLAAHAVALTAGGAYAMSAHTCALLDNGNIQCWGDNYDGQLGNALAINHLHPMDVTGLASGVTDVALGWYHTCAVVNGGVKCWGYNWSAQLGDGTNIAHNTPIDTSGLISGVVSIAAGGQHTCALTSTGGVKCWGANGVGQLGDGTVDVHTTPVDVTGLISGVVAIAAGGDHTCALTNTGGVKCWGADYVGACSMTFSRTPVDVCGLTSGVRAISVSSAHTCALTNNGVKCWGFNPYGQLGDGTTTTRPTPVNVTGLTGEVVAIAAGHTFTCAKLADGTVRCWGSNAFGQSSDGTVRNAQIIAAKGEHACAVLDGGGVQCWGWNLSGQLGDGTFNNSAAPRNVIGMASSAITVATGEQHTCAVITGGGLKCWGSNEHGMLGDGILSYSPIPVSVFNLEWRVYLPLLQRNYAAPQARFTAQPTSGLAPLAVTFNNTSTGSNITCGWDFGDGVTSTVTNPSHTYQFAGTYTTTLIVSDNYETATATTRIDVEAGRELIMTGGFEESLLAWQWTGYPDFANVTTAVAHSGSRSARLGIEPPDPLRYGYGTATYSIGGLPGVPHARLSFWYWPRREGLAGDPARSRQFAYITNGADKVLQKLFEFDEDLPGWQYAEFDLAPYAGQSIALQFGVYHDGNAVYDKRSALYVDDVSLTIDGEPFPIYRLAAYYPFTGNANDGSGNGNHGTVYGATLTADRFGRPNSAYHFDGINDYILTRYDSSVDFQQDLTAAAWIKTTDDAGAIALEHNGGGDGNFVFGLSQGGRFRFGQSAAVISGLYDSQFVNDDQWHFLVGVFDHSHGTVKHYIDGALVLTYADSSPLPNYHIPLIIGDENDHLSAFNGIIDDVRLYSRALADDEIQALWRVGP